MACAKPLLVCSPEKTPIINFLQPVGCAKLVTKTDMDEKVSIMRDWLLSIDRTQLSEMGKMGLYEIEDNYSKEVVTTRYVDLIKEVSKR